MGVAVDTVLGQVTNSVALTPVTVAPGDTTQVRSFPAGTAKAFLEAIIFKGGQAVNARVSSPTFHDNVRGINLISAQAPTQYNLPQEFGQPLRPNDALAFSLNSGAANSSVGALVNYYTDLPGAQARLHTYADISPYLRNVKIIEVDCAAAATIGQWSDTLLTATEGNLLQAETDYAVLGYQVDVAVGVVGIKGGETGNYRVCGPGTPLQDTTTDYFVEMSARHGVPHIPVFNSASAGSTFVSLADNAASTAVKVQLICAQLSQNLPRPSA